MVRRKKTECKENAVDHEIGSDCHDPSNDSNHLQFALPDPLAQWPRPRKLNRHYTEVKLESDKLMHGFEALDSSS